MQVKIDFGCSGQRRGRREGSEFSNIYIISDLYNRMLRKKNYKDQDHFTQYYSAVVQKANGSRLTIYYKRYRPAKKIEMSVYNALHGDQIKKEQVSQYPIDRTLQVLSFDGSLDIVRPIFKKVGKIRRFFSGQTKYSGKTAYYCIVIFKYQFDLVKCFRDDDFLQNIIHEQMEGARPSEQVLEQNRRELIATHLGSELQQAKKLQQLYADGFNPITNKFGEFKVDFQANQRSIEELPQIKRKKKLQSQSNEERHD